MKKKVMKEKAVFSLSPNILEFLKQFENKSRYVEHLIYKDLKSNDLLEKGEFVWMD